MIDPGKTRRTVPRASPEGLTASRPESSLLGAPAEGRPLSEAPPSERTRGFHACGFAVRPAWAFRACDARGKPRSPSSGFRGLRTDRLADAAPSPNSRVPVLLPSTAPSRRLSASTSQKPLPEPRATSPQRARRERSTSPRTPRPSRRRRRPERTLCGGAEDLLLAAPGVPDARTEVRTSGGRRARADTSSREAVLLVPAVARPALRKGPDSPPASTELPGMPSASPGGVCLVPSLAGSVSRR